MNKMGTFMKSAEINKEKAVYPADFAAGTPVSVGFVDKNAINGFTYVAAWILAKMPTKDTELDNYRISFGKQKGIAKKREPMVVPITSIHAPSLAGKRVFLS